MAAWLAYLKSRLLLPPDPAEEGPSGDELAAHLAFQLQRLEAMRDAAARLMARDQLGRDVFARGEPRAVGARGPRRAHRDAGRPDARLCADQDPRRLHAAAPGARAGLHAWSRRSSGCAGCSAPRSTGCELAAWLPDGLARRAGAAALGDRGELRGGAGAGEGRAAAAAAGGAVRADLPAAAHGRTRDERDRPRASSPTAPSRCRRRPSRSGWSRRCSSPAARR